MGTNALMNVWSRWSVKLNVWLCGHPHHTETAGEKLMNDDVIHQS